MGPLKVGYVGSSRSLQSCLWLLIALFGGLLLAPAANAQDNWPSKPVRIYVAHAPGTVLDVLARRVGDHLSKNIGQPVIVENKPGAGGTIGAAAFAKLAPDGYSIMLGAIAELAVGPAFYDNLSYDPLKSFAPITRLGESSAVLVVDPKLGVKTFAELVALAKSRPGKLTCGSFGNGSISQLMLLQLNRSVGTEIVHIPYKDAAAALTDVMGGQISMMFNWPTVIDPFIKSGQLVPVLTTGKERLPLMPDVASATELGLPQMVILGWSGFIASAGTPRPLIDRLNRELIRAAQTPEVQGQAEKVGSRLTLGTPEAFAEQLRQDVRSAAALVKEAGAKIQ